jgi:hypothetical protein
LAKTAPAPAFVPQLGLGVVHLLNSIRPWALACVAALAAAALLGSRGEAQNFAVPWHTVDGGGGTSTGGIYSVSGTIGQPDAGVLRGGNYALLGGFWGVAAAVQTAGAPHLYVTNTGGSIAIFWARPAEGWVLDQTPTLTGSPPPWTQVALPYQTNATLIYLTLPAPAGTRFYRLRRP